MKKFLFFFLFLGIATSFFYCSKKTDSASTAKLIQKTPADNEVGKLKVGDGGGGSSSCNCGTGLSSCIADCLFSDCCVCWDPKKSEGACGCYFGIAKCKTAPIGANSLASESHSVKLYHYKFDEYLEFLKEIPSNLEPLKNAFKALVKFSKPDKSSLNGESVLVMENNYDSFYKSYTDYINTLTEANKALIIEYISKKSVKSE